jgi:hypothetical protein
MKRLGLILISRLRVRQSEKRRTWRTGPADFQKKMHGHSVDFFVEKTEVERDYEGFVTHARRCVNVHKKKWLFAH